MSGSFPSFYPSPRTKTKPFSLQHTQIGDFSLHIALIIYHGDMVGDPQFLTNISTVSFLLFLNIFPLNIVSQEHAIYYTSLLLSSTHDSSLPHYLLFSLTSSLTVIYIYLQTCRLPWKNLVSDCMTFPLIVLLSKFLVASIYNMWFKSSPILQSLCPKKLGAIFNASPSLRLQKIILNNSFKLYSKNVFKNQQFSPLVINTQSKLLFSIVWSIENLSDQTSVSSQYNSLIGSSDVE